LRLDLLSVLVHFKGKAHSVHVHMQARWNGQQMVS
jgi:hypothetical protein